MCWIEKIGKKLYWLPSILMALDSCMKFFPSLYWERLSQIVPEYKIIWIGIFELCIVFIFLFFNTKSIGFFLIVAFWGGAIGVNFNHENFNLFPICILFLFSISMLFKKSSFRKKKFIIIIW